MNLYQQIVEIARPYLGIVTDKFIARQCNSHLKIDPDSLTKSNLMDLARWVEVSGKLVMPAEKAAELKQKILALG